MHETPMLENSHLKLPEMYKNAGVEKINKK
jgi:hypothetical protein